MPTVPSTCVPLDPIISVPLSDPASDESIAGPTPDPDTDDIVLVPADDGNAVSQDNPERAPPQITLKSRIDLDSLNLHSPSSIVGTPFDPSPRFEYPFPPTCAPPMLQDFEPVVPSFSLLTSPHAAFPPVPSYLPISLPLPPPSMASSIPTRSKADSRAFSPTHPKLHARAPPVPPGLVQKRKLISQTGEPVPSGVPHGRGRGASMSIVSEKLQPLLVADHNHHDNPDRIGYHDKSRAPDVKRKRNTLALGEACRAMVDGEQLGQVKAALSHSNSSPSLVQTFHPIPHQRPSSPSPPYPETGAQ